MEKKEKFLKFPKDFLWGASTSAYQIEGGTVNDWSQWETSPKRLADLKKRGLNQRDFICGQACDSFNRWKEDVELVKELNLNSYRLGLEWARLEPREGEFDEEAIKYYRRLLTSLKKSGIKTVVTLWHWTNPTWIADIGGWANKKTVIYYDLYVSRVCRELGDLVDYWLTLNEPTIHLANGYLKGNFPPNKRNIFSAFKVFKNLIKAHNTAYRLIHTQIPMAKVGVTCLYNDFTPARRWFLLEVFLAWLFDFFNNRLFLGGIKKNLDFIGLDYYFHDRIIWHPPFIKNLNKETTDLGWEIYQIGMYDVLKKLQRYRQPIIVMENGLADASDAKREKFIVDHLRQIHRAISDGVPVKGYFHWALIDNFEWAYGWAPKFGLVAVDRETFERQVKPSGYAYARICRDNEI
ncbi:MAG: glycoside hydrolase family 1 protein [Patescibacteria group bacterium]|jgi:beta-glucosidase